ncbi:MDR family MFS transporter [Desmospora activa]|nr:MFS transporter [Desmospora activa]
MPGRLRHLYQEYHPLVWVLAGGTMFARAASFMSLPFLALYLARSSELPPWLIGLVVGMGALAGTFGGFVGGYLSDRWGRGVVMVTTLYGWVVVFIGFALATEVWMFLLLNTLNGLCRSFFEPTSQALMADLTPPEKRMRVFGIRYMAINVGAALGPLIGAYLAWMSGTAAFWLTSAIYLAYAVVLTGLMTRYRAELSSQSGGADRIRVGEAFAVIRRDLALGFFILGGILGHIGYAQNESNLPLHLDQLFGEHNAWYPTLLALNAVTVILLQMVITRWGEKRSILSNMMLGSGLLAAGLLFFAFGGSGWWFLAGMFILTLGEILLFPSSSLFIDRLAPEHLRGTYFGASNFRSIGFFIGPAMGGWMLGEWGGMAMFTFVAVIAGGGAVFFWWGHRAWLRQQAAKAKDAPLPQAFVGK